MAKSQSHAMHLGLDYDIGLDPLKNGETFTLALASSLSRDVVGADDENTAGLRCLSRDPTEEEKWILKRIDYE